MAKTKEEQRAKEQRQPQGERQRESEQQSSQALQTTTERGGGKPWGITRREQYAPTTWAGSSPFAFMRRFSEEMDRLFEDFRLGRGLLAPTFGSGLSRLGELERSMWSPQVEVFERGG